MATIPTDVMRKVQAAIKQAQSAACGGRPTTLDNETGSSDQLLSLFSFIPRVPIKRVMVVSIC